MALLIEPFTKADGALGTTNVGLAWQVRRGTVTVKSQRGFAENVSPGSYAIVAAGSGNFTASVTLGSGGGQALYFRETDVSNWWRLTQRYYSYSVQTSSTPIEYEWAQRYYYGSATFGTLHQHTSYAWSTSSTTSPLVTSYNHTHDGFGHTMLQDGAAYRTGATRGGQPIYSTVYAYEVRLERCVAGSVTLVKSASGSASALKVVALGQAIECYTSLGATTPVFTVYDSTHATAGNHGFGYAETTSIGNSDGIDDFTLSYNEPPFAPLLLSPATNESLNSGLTNRFAWEHRDPNGDGQAGYHFRYRPVNTATWTVATVSTPNSYRDVPAGTFTAGTSYEWQVATYDSSNLTSTYSSSGFFSAAAPPAGPSITAPVAGGTVGGSSGLLTWTTADQDAYRVRKVADNAGTADTSTVLYDSGEVVDAVTRSVTLSFPVNSRYEHLQVQVQDAGLWSAWASVRILVSYTPPAKAEVSIFTNLVNYSLTVAVKNPTPSSGQPARAYNRIFCTALTPGDWMRPMGVRKLVAPKLLGDVFIDDRVVSGVGYGYDVETIANNGTTSLSEFVTGETVLSDGPEGFYADSNYDPTKYD